MITANLVKKMARQIGFDLAGITNARPLSELVQLLRSRQKEGWEPEFAASKIEERVDPRRFFPEAKSVVMVGLNYYNPLQKKKSLTGRLARTAWGLDYHRVLGAKLEILGQSLKGLDSGIAYRIFVDTGPLVERELARRAGLGWIGKNGTLITPAFGSWVFLGGMAINCELEEDVPLDRDCGDCQQCLKACPGGALEGAYQVNPHRCLSYLTQKKGRLSDAEREGLGERLYGCDTCQEACPVNRERAKLTATEDLKPRGHEQLSLGEIIRLTNKEFQKLFGPTAAGWRGKTNIKRNAIIGLGNSGNPGVVPLLKEAVRDPSPIIRENAIWALGRYGGDEATEVLREALAREGDETIRQEIIGLLNGIQKNDKRSY